MGFVEFVEFVEFIELESVDICSGWVIFGFPGI